MKTLNYADVSVGDALPALEVPITTSLVACGALATRDFEPCHHNKSVAQSMGMPDIFMNIMTSQAFMARFVTDWSGPEATVKAINVKLGAPNVPGMTMTVSGAVTAKDDSSNKISVQVTGENNVWGEHMSGIVDITLPN